MGKITNTWREITEKRNIIIIQKKREIRKNWKFVEKRIISKYNLIKYWMW